MELTRLRGALSRADLSDTDFPVYLDWLSEVGASVIQGCRAQLDGGNYLVPLLTPYSHALNSSIAKSMRFSGDGGEIRRLLTTKAPLAPASSFPRSLPGVGQSSKGRMPMLGSSPTQ